MDKEKINNSDDFIKLNSIIFKKYRIKNKLAEGAFGDIYLGSAIDTNEPVAIKVEPKRIIKPLLEAEAYFLFALRGIGIPEVLSFGRRKNYNFLVEPLLGKSLFDIFNERRKHMALGDICLIGKQIIDRIQWVHSKGFVHRDIKPDNFLIGRKDPNVIYLIDFGLSKKYKSDKTGKHLKFGFTGKLTGTVRFASANALRGGEQSRRDDLESIAYMIIFFMRGKLPWQGVSGTKKMERYLKIYKMKKNVTPEDLCKSLPPQMISFVKYVKHLEFEQDPDYNYLRKIFQSILKQRKLNIDSLVFSWIKTADIKNLKDPINPATRKESPQGRLYKKIENKLKSERNNSSDNDSGQRSYTPSNDIRQVEKEENYTSKDEAEINDNNYKSKKEKSKEGLNTLVTQLNQSIDENVNFDDTEKKNDAIKKKNYTVNDTLDFKSELKIKNNLGTFSSNKNKEIIRDKSEEIRLSNYNERKMSLQEIDEKEEKNNEKEEVNKIKKEDNTNNLIRENDINKLNQKQKIIPIDKGKIKSMPINNISTQKNSNNINLINKNKIIDNNLESPENSDDNNIEQIKKEKEKEKEMNNNNIAKIENDKGNNINDKENTLNLIKMQKKNNLPNKLISKINKSNEEKISEVIREKKQNKNNNNIHQIIHNKKDIKNLKIKNPPMKYQKINIKTKKIRIDKKTPKLNLENVEGPMDNRRKKLGRYDENKIFNTEISNREEPNDYSVRNVNQYLNEIKIQNKNNNTERKNTPDNNMEPYNFNNIKNNNLMIENKNKFKRHLLTSGNNEIPNLELLPKNSDEIDKGPAGYSISNNNTYNFNKDNINSTKLSNSLNLLQNDNNINFYNNVKSNKNMNSKYANSKRNNKRFKPEKNNFINNTNDYEIKNNISNIKNHNFEYPKNVEFNSNRKIRLVNRNKNPNKNSNPNNNIKDPNYKNYILYKTFSDYPGNNTSNYKPHNININNNINNNIIINHNINNKYSQPMNSSFRSNSSNPYSGQNMMAQNYILNKRPSHNINSNKITHSFKMYMNPNSNPIQYKKRPSYINKNSNNINNNFYPINQIIVNKRPSYNSNFNVSNFLNNTEPNRVPIGFTKIKKLPVNNINLHNSLGGKNIEIVRDTRDLKNRERFGNIPGPENYAQNLNNTYGYNTNMMNQYKINNTNNISNNIIINKINNKENTPKYIDLPDKRIIAPINNINYPSNKDVNNFNNNNNKIMIEKIQNYKSSNQSKIGNYQNISNQFNNNMQYNIFNNY